MDKKNLYFEPKKEENILYPEPVDKKDDPEPIDNRTDFGKDIFYLTCDGKKCATMEEVIQYNQMYYESMMKKDDDYYEKEVMKR